MMHTSDNRRQTRKGLLVKLFNVTLKSLREGGMRGGLDLVICVDKMKCMRCKHEESCKEQIGNVKCRKETEDCLGCDENYV